MKYTIDAENKKLGRLASEVASILMGKNSSSFAKNNVAGVKVKVINTSKISISNKKILQKVYTSYSGFPGGLKNRNMKDVLANNGGMKEVFLEATKGMLPKNKLRDRMLKNLIITE